MLAFATTLHAAQPAGPEDAVRAFYSRAMPLRLAGLPSSSQLRLLQPVVSSSLLRELRAASEAEARHRNASRNREPPLWEGDPFSSLFEGAREASVGTCRSEGDHAQCAVSLGFKDAFGGAHQWQDRAILVRERNRWTIDDIGYEARWAFGNKGTLRANLKHVVEAAPKEPPNASAARKGSRARGK